MAGPAAKPNGLRRRRNPTPGFKLLPHEGRTGDPPPWPLPRHPDPVLDGLEARKWEELWTLPQAVEWERMRDFGTVALYVRVYVEAAMPGADEKLLTQVRQLDAKIGISPRAMRDLHWETDEPLPDEPDTPPDPPAPRVYVPKKA